MNTVKSVIKVALVVNDFVKAASNDVFAEIYSSADRLEFDIDVYSLHCGNGYSNYIDVKKIHWFDFFKLSRYDVVHSHGPRPAALFWLWSWYLKVPHIMTVHSYIFDETGSRRGAFLGNIICKIWIFLIKKSNCIVFLTEAMRSYYLKFKIRNKTIVINNGLDLIKDYTIPYDDYVFMNDLRKRAKVVGAVGRVTEIKGFQHIIKSLLDLPEWYFILVGDGNYMQSLISYAESLGVNNRFKPIGSRRNGSRYFKYFDVACVPSISEGFGFVCLEAIYAETSVVCSRIESFAELFRDDEVTFVTNEYATAILSAVAKTSACKRIVKNTVSSRFTVQKMVGKYLDQYRIMSHKRICQ